jgi:hypothetical protein
MNPSPLTIPLVSVLLGALAPIGFYLIARKLASGQPHRDEIAHAIDTFPRIHAQLPKLLEADQEARDALCTTIAKDIREDCFFLTFVTWRRLRYAQAEQKPIPNKPTDSQHPAYAVLRDVRRLDRNIRKILLLARRRPDRIRDGRHIAYAAVQHTQLWIEYMRFLRNLYPETYAGLVLAGDTPIGFARSA